MARSHISDFMQTGRFHLLDVSFSIPPVLLPIFSFRSITMPALTVEMRNIKEGNYEYPRKVVQSASVSPCTLEQGVSLTNSDFYDWIRKAVVGRVAPKNLLLVQFTRINELGNKQAAAGTSLAFPGSSGGGLFGQAITGNVEFAVRLPGRAWLFKECRPSSYRPASDFDAMSQEISLASLDLELESFEEFSLGI